MHCGLNWLLELSFFLSFFLSLFLLFPTLSCLYSFWSYSLRSIHSFLHLPFFPSFIRSFFLLFRTPSCLYSFWYYAFRSIHSFLHLPFFLPSSLFLSFFLTSKAAAVSRSSAQLIDRFIPSSSLLSFIHSLSLPSPPNPIMFILFLILLFSLDSFLPSSSLLSFFASSLPSFFSLPHHVYTRFDTTLFARFIPSFSFLAFFHSFFLSAEIKEKNNQIFHQNYEWIHLTNW